MYLAGHLNCPAHCSTYKHSAHLHLAVGLESLHETQKQDLCLRGLSTGVATDCSEKYMPTHAPVLHACLQPFNMHAPEQHSFSCVEARGHTMFCSAGQRVHTVSIPRASTSGFQTYHPTPAKTLKSQQSHHGQMPLPSLPCIQLRVHSPRPS